jgi:hypothetical protein
MKILQFAGLLTLIIVANSCGIPPCSGYQAPRARQIRSNVQATSRVQQQQYLTQTSRGQQQQQYLTQTTQKPKVSGNNANGLFNLIGNNGPVFSPSNNSSVGNFTFGATSLSTGNNSPTSSANGYGTSKINTGNITQLSGRGAGLSGDLQQGLAFNDFSSGGFSGSLPVIQKPVVPSSLGRFVPSTQIQQPKTSVQTSTTTGNLTLEGYVPALQIVNRPATVTIPTSTTTTVRTVQTRGPPNVSITGSGLPCQQGCTHCANPCH